MVWKSILKWLLSGTLLATIPSAASEHHGKVVFHGIPVPGATVTATHDAKHLMTVTDVQGVYSFRDLPDGVWTIQVEMPLFSTLTQNLTVASGTAPVEWNLALLPQNEIQALIKRPEASQAPQTSTVAATGNTSDAGNSKNQSDTLSTGNSVGQTPAARMENGFQRAELMAVSPSGTLDGTALSAEPGIDTEDPAQFNQNAADELLVSGSVNNGAASPYAQSPAFGNNRTAKTKGLYNGNLGFSVDNSTLDARPFSLTGQDTAKPDYNRVQGTVSFGGPLKVPRLFQNGPTFYIGYQWLRNRNASTQAGLMPTLAERNGDFSQTLNSLGKPLEIVDPTTGRPFPNNMLPQNRISSQARALLKLYPLPNFAGGTGYNYQAPILGVTHQDNLQVRLNKILDPKNQVAARMGFQSARSDGENLFGFLDKSHSRGISSNLNWSHSLSPRLYMNLGYQFNRTTALVTPFFENVENISGNAGITGNNQNPLNWGPPNLSFAGMTGLSDGQHSFNRTETNAFSFAILWNRFNHNFSFGGDFRRLQLNYFSQQDPRGAFTFTGAATQAVSNGIPVSVTGLDVADFLLGIPDTSSIAFGNPDKYLRSSSYDAYFSDDWRAAPGFSLNAGIRWEYSTPFTELHGRLVNLDVTPGFASVTPVTATNPVGPLTGRNYGDALLSSDRHGFEPRIGLAWRPWAASSLIVRAGYGVAYNASVYQTIAAQMMQQPPFSTTLSVQNTPALPLTLANGFKTLPAAIPNTFAVDPNFRLGYAQNWQLSVQRDLPGAMIVTAAYLGIKGTREPREYLPNTFPVGAGNPCPACPAGYVFLDSNGNSTRESGQIQLQRRLHSGFAASLQYTFSKSIDDSSLQVGRGGSAIAQNWLDLGAERALSSFDQRHLLRAQLQYTTGMGLAGGTLLSGWQGRLFKEWTALTQITVGSGLPLTPVFLQAVSSTGITGSIRPSLTGAPIYSAPPGLFLNPAAFAPPPPGEWGNAGRNSITGPNQFTFNASLSRTFRLTDRFNMDLRVDATNPLNHVTFPSWNTTAASPQFGLPNAANPMRSLQTSLRARF